MSLRGLGLPSAIASPTLHDIDGVKLQGGTRAARSAHQEAGAAARGGCLWTHRCKRCEEIGQSLPKPRGGSIVCSSVRSRSQIACSASASGLSRRLSGRLSSQAAYSI